MYKMMLLVHLLMLFSVIGFAYIIWVMASKEQGWVRLGGQILAVLIKLTVLIIFIICIFYAPKMGMCGMGGNDMMMKKMMMGKDGKMMQGKDMKKMMEKMQKECK